MKTGEMPGHLIRRLQQHSNAVFARHMRDHGWDITSVQFAALDAIRINPKIDQAGVASLIAYDRPTIGEVVTRLVTKGLVERTVSQADRRARLLRLTPKGEQLFIQLAPVVEGLQDDILIGLSAGEREEFRRLLNRAVSGAGQ